MGVKDRNVLPTAKLPIKITEAFVNPPISQAGIIVFKYVPGYKFQIVRVSTYCRTKAGTVSFTVTIGARTAVAAGSFGAGNFVAQTLSAVIANLQGSATDDISISMTTDGSGALVDGRVILEFRPRPLDGEAALGESS